eukprot:s1963_g4.t2
MYSARSRSRGRRVRSGGRGDDHRRSRSRHGEGGSRRRKREKDGRDEDRADDFGAAAAWGPYAGYGAYAAAAASYWDYAQHAQQAAVEDARMIPEDKKKKKKKKKKRGQSSSSSSSSSSQNDAAAQWAEMWRSWQGGATPSGPPPAQGHPMAWNQWGGVPSQAPGWPGPPPDGGSMGSFDGRDTGWAVAEREDDERSGPAEDVPIFLEPSVEDEVAVPKALLGKVIGKQAATIIEIREKSGAFKVDARDQTSDPCMVKVAGTAEAVKKAKDLILELIDQTKQKHLSSHYVEIPRSKIGMVIGLKGAQVNEVQAQTQTKIDVDFETDPCKCYIKGEADNVDRAKKVLLTIAMQLEDEASEYLDLPKTVSGALIGAQGSRIRQFQETSGARIDIDKSGNRCKVRLTGSKEAVSIAKSLIQAELDKNMVPTKTPGSMASSGAGVSHGPVAVPAHQPSSFPATLSESIARARAAAEAVKHGLIPSGPPEGSPVNPPPPAPLPVPPPPRPPGAPKGGHWGGGGRQSPESPDTSAGSFVASRASCSGLSSEDKDAAMMALRVIIVAVLSVPTLGTVLARTKLRQGSKSWQDFSPCSCSECLGEHKNEGGDGSVGFQCFPKASGLADCRQTEPVAARVVQSADVVSYDRFCLYTCKPLLTDEIKPVVDCAHLNDKEITDLAQSPSSNGREIVYEAHPLARVGPISRVLAQPEASMLDTSVVDRSAGDPVSAIRATFASLRKEERAAPGVSPYTLPDAAKAPPLCVCHCGNKVNRMRQTESDGILYPKPKQVRLPLAVTSAGNPAAQPEPPQPPMPPPPPAEMPPPSMPLGLFPGQELPPIPEAPLEITAPLPPAEIGLADVPEKQKPVSFLQQASAPVACNCIC